MRFLIVPVLVIIFIYIKNVVSIDCFWSSECKYKYFSSKTPYENIRGDIRDSIVKLEGCEPISVWAIIRHGKRNPGSTFLQDMKVVLNFKDDIISSYDDGNSSLCAQDIENLRVWKLDKSFTEEPNKITSEGYQEMVGIGRRLKEALPELLNDLNEEDYSFQATSCHRTRSSREALIEGFTYKLLDIEQKNHNSSIANPYGACRKYLDEVFYNPDTYNETLVYMQTADYINMKQNIEKRLGLNFTLTDKHIIALYDVCRYTSDGIRNKFSPWCAVFSTEDLQVLEYIGDLQHYYRNGYGVSQYSEIFGQIPLADLMKSLEDAKDGKGKSVVAYVTHSTILDMIQVALNLSKDASPLTGAYRDLNRQWRSTFISTFGANMIAILHRCKKYDDIGYNYKIVFYWNESPILKLCNAGICSWQEFENIFKHFLNATTDFCDYA